MAAVAVAPSAAPAPAPAPGPAPAPAPAPGAGPSVVDLAAERARRGLPPARPLPGTPQLPPVNARGRVLARAAGRVAVRFVPYVGWGMLAYDAYQLYQWYNTPTPTPSPEPGAAPGGGAAQEPAQAPTASSPGATPAQGQSPSPGAQADPAANVQVRGRYRQRCDKLRNAIERQRDELNGKRTTGLTQNPGGQHMFDPYRTSPHADDVWGHMVKFRLVQRELQKNIDEYLAKNCGPLPPGAQEAASMNIPTPNPVPRPPQPRPNLP